jgi:HEAT repeat protein
MDEQMASRVEELLSHKDYAIRALAVRTLGQLRSGSSVDRLQEILLDRAWIMGKKAKALQMDAARALAEIGTTEAKGILHQMAGKGSGELQALCRELLQRRGEDP